MQKRDDRNGDVDNPKPNSKRLIENVEDRDGRNCRRRDASCGAEEVRSKVVNSPSYLHASHHLRNALAGETFKDNGVYHRSSPISVEVTREENGLHADKRERRSALVSRRARAVANVQEDRRKAKSETASEGRRSR